MPILLMSSGNYFTEKAEKKLKTSFTDKKIGYVITASVVAKDKEYIKQRKQRMDELGWDYEEIDIAGKSEAQLKKIF